MMKEMRPQGPGCRSEGAKRSFDPRGGMTQTAPLTEGAKGSFDPRGQMAYSSNYCSSHQRDPYHGIAFVACIR